ncbi:hypothetical protein B0I37DRAFT_348734 [Chaetomium sp. MPI-CAGE-AT-0009]|nr:hypothetical protein B0I37DRAFT_348734 [Chaetomium sp. MPI-CAGE-AT-0009]
MNPAQPRRNSGSPRTKDSSLPTYGTLGDQSSQFPRTYSIDPTPRVEESQSCSVVSLRGIFEQGGRFPAVFYRDRLRLAVAISSSVLQLHDTPWLPRILTSRDIFFLQKNNAPNPVMYQRPMLLKQLPNGEAQPADIETGIAGEHNPALLSLGCVLIELILGRPLHSGRAATAASRPGSGLDLMSDVQAARRLLDEVRMKSTNYERAVARCVDGKLHRRGRGLEDGDLCHDIYRDSQVIALLKRDLENS